MVRISLETTNRIVSISVLKYTTTSDISVSTNIWRQIRPQKTARYDSPYRSSELPLKRINVKISMLMRSMVKSPVSPSKEKKERTALNEKIIVM
jgi:hypothetical protein